MMTRYNIVPRYDYDYINIHACSAMRLSKELSWLLDTMHIRNMLTDTDNHKKKMARDGLPGHFPLGPEKGCGVTLRSGAARSMGRGLRDRIPTSRHGWGIGL